MRIIALAGKFHVGHTTIALSLRKTLIEIGQKVAVIGVASTYNDMNTALVKNMPALWLGGMLRQNVTAINEPGIWARCISNKLVRLQNNRYDYAIIHDCRFDDEKDVIEKHGGHVFELQSDNRGVNSDSVANTCHMNWPNSIKIDCDQHISIVISTILSTSSTLNK